jgi:hypothetical protein
MPDILSQIARHVVLIHLCEGSCIPSHFIYAVTSFIKVDYTVRTKYVNFRKEADNTRIRNSMAVWMGMNSLGRADTAKRQDERTSVWIRVSGGV